MRQVLHLDWSFAPYRAILGESSSTFMIYVSRPRKLATTQHPHGACSVLVMNTRPAALPQEDRITYMFSPAMVAVFFSLNVLWRIIRALLSLIIGTCSVPTLISPPHDRFSIFAPLALSTDSFNSRRLGHKQPDSALQKSAYKACYPLLRPNTDRLDLLRMDSHKSDARCFSLALHVAVCHPPVRLRSSSQSSHNLQYRQPFGC